MANETLKAFGFTAAAKVWSKSTPNYCIYPQTTHQALNLETTPFTFCLTLNIHLPTCGLWPDSILCLGTKVEVLFFLS